MTNNIFAIPDWALSNKEKIIRCHAEGLSVSQTAVRLGLSPSWIREIVREYRKFYRSRELAAHGVEA